MAQDNAPSAQVLLANERTFLAWIRTALALVATGVALVAFEVPMPGHLRLISSSLFLLLGIAATVQAWIGWRATDAAARGGKPIPAPVTRTLMFAGVTLAIVVVGAGLLLGAE